DHMEIPRPGVLRRQGHVYNEVDHVSMVMEGRPCRCRDDCRDRLCGGANARSRPYARADEPGRFRPAADDAAERHARPDDARWHGRRDGPARHDDGKQTSGQPVMPGQEVFGTIQEIVRILEADPATDWSKVNISALREHLIDMDEATMRAAATERALDNGIEIAVTGEGRTLDAIRRMIPAHVHELSQLGWNAKTEDLPNGVKLTVISTDARQATKLRALGFMGIMVQGAHHQQHHLMMAKSEFTH